MTSTRALSLAARTPALPVVAERGRMMNAEDVAQEVWHGKVSAKWVIQKTRSIAFKPGREWLWYETEAIKWREDWLAAQRKRA